MSLTNFVRLFLPTTEKGHEENLDGAVLIYENTTHCEIAEWLCENPIDARGIIEEMEKQWTELFNSTPIYKQENSILKNQVDTLQLESEFE